MTPQDRVPSAATPGDATRRAELAAAQEALVAALVAGGPLPPGFDAAGVEAASRALLRKRAGEVARTWPRLAMAYGERWPVAFAEWARDRPAQGAWRDGWDFARARPGSRTRAAALELALREAEWSYDGRTEPRRRRVSARRVPGGMIVRAFGRTRLLTPGVRHRY
jgi:hypothetical protein